MKDRTLKIVGLEELLDPASPRHLKKPLPKKLDYETHKAVLKGLVEKENEKTESEKRKDAPVLSLEFVSYAEYLKNHDWEGEVGWDVARNMIHSVNARRRRDIKLKKKAKDASKGQKASQTK